VTIAAAVFRWLLSGVCGQIPAHSFVVHGEALPLCARCTGTHVGILVGLLTWRLSRKSRSSALPPLRVVVVLAAFIGAWALDGLNSFLTLLRDGPSLYAPSNALRLSTGMLNGLALATLVHPLFNFVAWDEPDQGPTVSGLRGLMPPLALLATLLALALIGPPIGHRGLFIIASIGLITSLTLVNAAGALVLLHREQRARRWRELLLPLVLGFLASLAEVAALALLTNWIRSGWLKPGLLG